ncbi:MAG TPA: alpha/beta fold hydrolase [Candidatus Angelobacter sp.]
MQANESWIETNRQRMRFLHAGSGPPLLLLGGLLGGSLCWRHNIRALAAGYNVYAVDLPGLGLSRDIGIDCSMSQQVQHLVGFATQMGWKEFSVVGSSFGGAIAMLLAGQNFGGASRVRSLLLSSPVNPWSDFGRRRIRHLSSRLGGCLLRAVLPISHPVHGIALRRMYGDPMRVSQDAIKGYRAIILRPGRARNILTALRKWQQDVNSLEPIIPQLDIPVLLIWGTHDRAVDPRSATILKERLPQADLKLIPGAGHLPFEEAPEEFNQLSLEFLAKVHPRW